jgi:predicted PurR-regulated permease PerM
LPPESIGGLELARKVLITSVILVLVGFCAFMLWYALGVFFLIFGGILIAVLVRGVGRILTDRLRVPEKAAVTFVIFLIAAMIFAFATLFGVQIQNEIVLLMEELPSALDHLESTLGSSGPGRFAVQEMPKVSELAGSLWSNVSSFFSSVTGFLFSIAFMAFLGIYLSYDPHLYIRGILRLCPVNKRDHVSRALDTVGHILQWWLIGRLISMSVLGALTGIGLWLMGMKLAFTLGVFAAVISFVPYIGPIIAFVPIALLAVTSGWYMVLYVFALYMGIQTVESYILTPLVVQRTVAIPPLLTLTAQMLMGMAAGLVGLIFAMPVTAMIIVLVKYFYVRDVLGDTIDIAGEENRSEHWA